MIKVNHFMSDELGKMVGDELGSELWQKGMMNEIRRYPNEIPCENGEIPSVIIPKCGGFEKVEWGFTAGMSCLVPKAPGEIEIRNALHFPASATLALLSLLYDEGTTNGKSISLTLHIPENADKFREYLNRALQKLPNVHAATVSLPAVKGSINTGSDQFTGGSSVASCVGAQVVDVGRIQFSAKLQSGSFKVGDIAAITDGDLNVIARYCPILDLSNAAGQDISSTEGCGTTFGAYIAVWFPPNSEFDSLYIVNEGNPVFTPARMPEKPTLSPKNSKAVSSQSSVSSADFVIENGVLKKYTGKGGNVVIPDGVTSIGDSAFEDCEGLTGITIPDSVESIGDDAFSGCESLTSITIPNSVTSIGDGAFTKCNGLADQKGFVIIHGVLYGYFGEDSSVIIPNNVTGISYGAFNWCTNLTNITIPNSVTEICDYAFSFCNSLTSITIPNSVKSIGDEAFAGCEKLTTIFIPKSVVTIGDGAFQGCEGLADRNGFVIVRGVLYDYFGEDSSVIIPNGVTGIGRWAFNCCDSMTDVTIPDSVASIGDWAFDSCENLTNITIPNGVTNIGDWAFKGCGSLTSITIPDSVESIGDEAFDGCESLTIVTIPKRLEGAFKNCKSIKKINYADGSTSVLAPASTLEKAALSPKNSKAVSSQSSVSSDDFVIENGVLKKYTGKGGNVVIPDGVTSIGEDAFNRCRRSGFITPDGVCVDGVVVVDKLKELSSVTIPDSVMSIGRRAFYEYESLTDINIPGSVTSIGKEAFCGCISLKNIILPNGINDIDDYTFHKCKNLTSITIPNSVTRIGDGAFECCESLTNITIPDSVKSIGDSAFSLCKSLTSITIHDSVESISDFAFYGCGSLTSVIIPNSVTSIGKWAFNRCGSLTSITISDSVESIGDEAFDGCKNLTSITIPKRLESAFKDCKSIKKINYTDDANRTGEDGGIVPGGAKSGKTEKADSGSKKQSYIARIEHEQTGGWHQYTVILQPGLNYSWDAIIANADSMADADLAPIMNIQLQTAWGVSKDLIKAYKNSGYRFSETNELTEDEGNMLCIGGISDALGCPTMITWFNQIYAFGITTEKERSDEQIRKYAETIVAKRFGESAVQADDSDEEETSSAGSTDSIGSYRIKKVTQCRTEAGENGMFPQGDSEDDAMAMMDLLMGIRKYWRIYRYEIELDSAPLKWKDCLRAATNMMYLDMLPEHFTYGCGKLETQPEKDITNSFFNIADCDLRLVPELKNESDFVAVRGSSLNLDADIKVYFHNGKKLITLYAPIADKEQIQEYAETKLCRVLAVEISGKDTKKEKTPASAADTGKTVPSKIPVSSDDFVIENRVLKKYTGKGGSVIIPNGVTRIGDSAFEERESLTSITIPDGVTSLGHTAFKKCTSLTEVTIPSSVTSIGIYAFSGCESLTSITIPDSVESIGHGAFCDCAGLADQNGFVIVRGVLDGYFGEDSNVVIPSGVTDISRWAFRGRKSLTSIIIPDSVTSIGDYAFYDCRSLTSIVLPNSVTSIGESAFMTCISLTSIAIPDSVTSIGDEAFIRCKGLADQKGFVIVRNVLYDYFGDDRNVVIPNGVTRIGSWAFNKCKNLTSITIPDSVTTIDDEAFDDCESLTSVTIPKRLKGALLEGAFKNCKSIKKITYTGNSFWKKLFKK